MTDAPIAPRLLKGGIVLIDPDTSAVLRTIVLQYNAETLQRRLEPRSVGDDADRAEALRLTGPPIETIEVEAEIDAADQLESPAQHPTTAQLGIHPQLAALEVIVYPESGRVESNRRRAALGTLEISPVEAPLTIFVWSAERVLPVRVTAFSIVERFFDPRLNPLRATIELSMRVLSTNDLGFDHPGGALFTAHHQRKEQLARSRPEGSPNVLGVRSIR